MSASRPCKVPQPSVQSHSVTTSLVRVTVRFLRSSLSRLGSTVFLEIHGVGDNVVDVDDDDGDHDDNDGDDDNDGLVLLRNPVGSS